MTLNDNGPKIWTKQGFIADEWVPYELLPSIEAEGKFLLPLSALKALTHADKTAFQDRLGAELMADEPVEALADELAYLALIALDFPKYADGRSYSKAHQLRAVLGYEGELRATGDVLIDQIQFMFRTGFDSLAITNQPTLTQIKAGGGEPFSYFYQPDDATAKAKPAPQNGAAYAWRRQSI